MSDWEGDLTGWLEENWDPDLTLREWWSRLAASGWSQAHWPKEWYGHGLSEGDGIRAANIIADFGAVPGPVGFGAGMAGPALLIHGTDEQKARHLPGIVDGTDGWCQLFSEPNAGSDLAGLQTRASRDGDEWIVNGQKVWTSEGQYANKALLICRTDPNVPKHPGLSFFFIDIDQPGIDMRPLREMTGRAYFNEVFITDARVDDADLIGGEGNGWAVANTVLAFERALSSGGRPPTLAIPGPIEGHLDQPAGRFVTGGATIDDEPEARAERLIRLARQLGRDRDPRVRDRLVRMYTLETIRSLTAQRAGAMADTGRELPGLPNLAKMAANHEYRLLQNLTCEILGMSAGLYSYADEELASLVGNLPVADHHELVEAVLAASGPPIYGGSDQIQRNIVGERILGLDREPNVEKGVAFKDLRKN